MSMFLRFWLMGTVFFAWHLHWITVIKHWSNLFWAVLSWILLSLALGLFVGAVGLFYGLLSKKISKNLFWPRAFLFSALWVFFEWLRSVGPWGMPASLLSTFLVPQPFFLQTLDLVGLWGQELLIVLFLITCGKLVWDFKKRRFDLKQNLIILGIFLLVMGYNTWSWQREFPSSASLNVAVLQPNTPQEHKLDSQYFADIEENLFLKSKEILAKTSEKVDFIVWPETVIPRLLLTDPGFLKKMADLKVPVLFGTPHFDTVGKLFNVMALYDPSNKAAVLQMYAKRHLVPFGEYLPLRKMFFWAKGSALDFMDYAPGAKTQNLMQYQNHSLGTLICFESMFSTLARDQVKRGAQILILITNDAWFLQTAGVAQHARFLVLQAIENRRAALQLGNSGMTYWVNAKGQIQNQLPPYQTTGAVWKIPLSDVR